MVYKISVRTINNKILTFTVDTFEVKHNFVVFKDKKTGIKKWFYAPKCEIQAMDYDQ